MKKLIAPSIVVVSAILLFMPSSCNLLEEVDDGPNLNKPKEKEVNFEMETVSYLKNEGQVSGNLAQVREQPTSYRSKIRFIAFEDGTTYMETIKESPKNKFIGQDDIPEGDYAKVHRTVFYNSKLTSYDGQGKKISEIDVPVINKPQDPLYTEARKQSITAMIDEAKRNGASITELGKGLIRIRMDNSLTNAARTQAGYEETVSSNILMDNVIDVENQLLVATTLYATDGTQIGYYAYNYQVVSGGELALSVIYQEMNVVVNVPAENVPAGFTQVTETYVTETRFENMEVIY
jgi:hypothetical protein